MKKSPPFSKVMLSEPDYSLTCYICIGTKAWDKARHFQNQKSAVLCLPAYLSPTDYKWPVKDRICLIIDTGYCDEDYVTDIAKSLFIYGAQIVFYSSKEDGLVKFSKGY